MTAPGEFASPPADDPQTAYFLARRAALPGQFEMQKVQIAYNKGEKKNDGSADQPGSSGKEQKNKHKVKAEHSRAHEQDIQQECGHPLAMAGNLQLQRHTLGRGERAAGAAEIAERPIHALSVVCHRPLLCRSGRNRTATMRP